MKSLPTFNFSRGIGLDHSKGVVAGSGQNENHKHLKEWKYE